MVEIIKPSVEVVYATPLSLVLHAGRHSYQSHDKATEQSDAQLLAHFLKNDESPLEQSFLMFDVVCSYAAHIHLARHRHLNVPPPSVCFLSQRYTTGLGMILPPGIAEDSFAGQDMIEAFRRDVELYERLREAGIKKQDARYALPQAAAVRGTISGNLRAWNKVLDLRTSKKAMPETRSVAEMMREALQTVWPEVVA